MSIEQRVKHEHQTHPPTLRRVAVHWRAYLRLAGVIGSALGEVAAMKRAGLDGGPCQFHELVSEWS